MNRAQYEAAAAKDMLERTLQGQVEALMRDTGWRYYHAPDNRPDRKGRVQNIRRGFPDLFAVHVRQGRRLAAELKKQDGRLSVEQKEWLADMEALGIETHVFRPADLFSGRILAVLTGRATTETKD